MEEAKDIADVIIEPKYKELSEFYTCSICCSAYGPSPVSFVPCGHTFCVGCAQRVTTCPLDRKTVRDRIPDRSVISFMNKIKCRCDNENCKMTFTMRERSKHLMFCPMKLVHCSNDGCKFSCPRKELPSHDCGCEFKLIQCPHPSCDKFCLRNDYSNHIETCTHKLFRCPGHTEGCSGIYTDINLPLHTGTCYFYHLARTRELEPLRRLLPKVRMIGIGNQNIAVLPSEKIRDVANSLQNIRGFEIYVQKSESLTEKFGFCETTTFADVPEGHAYFQSDIQDVSQKERPLKKKRKWNLSKTFQNNKHPANKKPFKMSYMTRMLRERYKKVEAHYEERIRKIYETHDVEKVDRVGDLVRTAGHEGAHALYEEICEEYGAEVEEAYDGSQWTDPDVMESITRQKPTNEPTRPSLPLVFSRPRRSAVARLFGSRPASAPLSNSNSFNVDSFATRSPAPVFDFSSLRNPPRRETNIEPTSLRNPPRGWLEWSGIHKRAES